MAEVIYIQWNSTWEWRLIRVWMDLSISGNPRDDPEAWGIVSNEILYGMFGPEGCRKKWIQLMDKFNECMSHVETHEKGLKLSVDHFFPYLQELLNFFSGETVPLEWVP